MHRKVVLFNLFLVLNKFLLNKFELCFSIPEKIDYNSQSNLYFFFSTLDKILNSKKRNFPISSSYGKDELNQAGGVSIIYM